MFKLNMRSLKLFRLILLAPLLLNVANIQLEASYKTLVSYQKFKKRQVLQRDTAKVITEIVEDIEKGNFEQARRTAEYLLSKNLRSYDRSVVLHYLGYLAFNDENFESAIDYYDAILNEPGVTLSIRNAAFATLIQLELAFENIEGAEYRVENELSIQGPTKELCQVIQALNERFSSRIFFQSPCA